MIALAKPISLRDLARRLGLSPMVVSSVLRERVNGVRFQASRVAEIRTAARQFGYRPNNDIGVLVPRPVGEATAIQHEILAGVEARIQATLGASSKVVTEVVEPGSMPAMIRDWQVGGVVVIGERGDSPVIADLESKGIPYAVANSHDSLTRNAVLSDERPGCAAILDHFVASACRRVVLALPPIAHRAGQERQRCFIDGCAERGLELVILPADNAEQTLGELAALARTQIHRSGLFIIAEWWLAASTMLTQQLGAARTDWVGGCLANTPLPWTRLPPTVVVPFAEMGREAVDLIHRCWALHDDRQTAIALPTYLRR